VDAEDVIANYVPVGPDVWIKDAREFARGLIEELDRNSFRVVKWTIVERPQFVIADDDN
jgi:hypothetical protein